MILFDHTDATWRESYKRVNGAETYSMDLVKHQAGNWGEVLGDDGLLSTCPRLEQIDHSVPVGQAVWYLHSFPKRRPVMNVAWSIRNKRFDAEAVTVLTASRRYARMMREAKIDARHVPMAIDVDHVRSYAAHEGRQDRFLWFGNIYRHRADVFHAIEARIPELDVISGGKFNGQRVTQEQAWMIASGYKYGIGVGRCALELFALGVKVLIAGRNIGGLIMNEADVQKQVAANFNGRVNTFSSKIGECVEAIGDSVLHISDITKVNHATQAGF